MRMCSPLRSKNVCSVMAVTSAPVSTLHSVSWPSSRSVIFQLLSDSNAPRNVLSKSGSSAVAGATVLLKHWEL